jgi:hypothetical protein
MRKYEIQQSFHKSKNLFNEIGLQKIVQKRRIQKHHHRPKQTLFHHSMIQLF